MQIHKTPLQALSEVKREGEEHLAQKRAKDLGLEYVNMDIVPLDLKDFELISEADSKAHRIAVIRQQGNQVLVGALDPEEEGAKTIIKGLKDKGLRVSVAVVSLSSLERAFDLYETIKHPGKTIAKTIIVDEERARDVLEKVQDREKLASVLKDTRDVSAFLEVLFLGAITARSSDIHVEPQEKQALIRLRIDGVLQDILAIEPSLYQRILTRVKVVSELKLNVKDLPQDGRLTFRSGIQERPDVEVRVSVIPSGFGETLVMRLLGVGIAQLSLEDLGMEEYQKELLLSTLKLPNGAILITGPTGSGKTTTLYASLAHVKNSDINVVTIENPIEYKLEGITQTQVNQKKGFTFASALRSVLRQDPDVVMVGEIRDAETADIAINAALTGHLMLSTLHTNDAPGAIERLQNLQVRTTLIPAALKLVIAQRLVRMLCPHCKEEHELTQEEQEAISHLLNLIPPKARVAVPKEFSRLWKPKGCSKCFGTGYFGQGGIFELFAINDVMEEQILKEATTYDLRRVAMEEGMITLLQHAMLRALAGHTSLEEVQRVAGDAKYIEEIYGKAMMAILGRAFRIPQEIYDHIASQRDIANIDSLIGALEEPDVLSGILGGALSFGASDVNFEAIKDKLEVKLRIDGVLQHLAWLPRDYLVYLVSSIKELANLTVGEHQRIQEGRFSVSHQTEKGLTSDDVRVSIIPSGYGETVVLRILPRSFTYNMDSLGIPAPLLPRIGQALEAPQGMIITTGPTGSGKTTALYTFLKRIDSSTKRIMTIEDPVEYTIEGAVQTQVNQEAGLGFTEAFRALLRQAPNVIMIGEIRDKETAQVAVNAALTGHLVLTTVHSNDSLSAIERLKGLEVDESVFLEALSLIFAQRLVRKLCPHCKVVEEGNETLRSRIGTLLGELNPAFLEGVDKERFTLYKARGCDECLNTGYTGRIGIFEVSFFSPTLQNLARNNTAKEEMEKVVLQEGGLFLRHDGALKLVAGLTSLEEIERVLGTL